LVLESESDYARFGIERTALSDILTVGKSGLVVEQRNALVIAATTKTPVQSNDKFKGKEKRVVNKPSKDGKRDDNDTYDFDGDDGDDGDDDDDHEALEAPKVMAESAGDGVPAGGEGNSRRPRQRPMEEEEKTESAADEISADALPAPPPRPPDVNVPEQREPSRMMAAPATTEVAQDGPPALSGQMARIYKSIESGKHAEAVAASLRWRSEESGSVMALVALGESLEAAGRLGLAARAYGSIIDLFPSRADLRRFASARLIRVEKAGAALSVDSLQRAAEQRADHLSVHRLLAYALVRSGDYEAAFKAIQTGLEQRYPSGRFAGGLRILKEDLGIIAAAWLAKEPNAEKRIHDALRVAGVSLATKASTRFVLNWETDANDVDFHIYDGAGGHAYYSSRELPSGGSLYDDVTTGYGPECFAIDGKASRYPYKLQIHYYSRGPMGYGMGQVEVMQHDGMGGLRFDERPFVVMNDQAFVDLGTVDGPLL
jgi:tetratricopeptide (TPR) repeat protein